MACAIEKLLRSFTPILVSFLIYFQCEMWVFFSHTPVGFFFFRPKPTQWGQNNRHWSILIRELVNNLETSVDFRTLWRHRSGSTATMFGVKIALFAYILHLSSCDWVSNYYVFLVFSGNHIVKVKTRPSKKFTTKYLTMLFFFYIRLRNGCLQFRNNCK